MLAVGALGATTAGCGGNHCKDAAECEGGNETDQEACETQVEALYSQAEVDGCTELVDAWQDCLSEEAACEDIGGGNKWGGNNCDDEFLKVANCTQGDGVVRL